MSNPKAAEISEGQSKIFRNTSYLTGAFVLQKIISFVYYTVVVDHIGVSKTGAYDPIKSLIPIALILIDFSLSAVITREIARNPGSTKTYLGNVLGIKLIFSLVVLAAFGLVTNFGSFSQEVQSSLYLVALIVAFDTFTLTFFAILRGLQNMKYEALGMIVNQLIAVGMGYAALRMGFGMRGVFFATVIASVVNFFWSMLAVRRYAKIWPKIMWDKNLIILLLKLALPFAVAAMLTKVYTYTDRYLLLAFKGSTSVAYYAIAHKLTFALEFLPSAFAASLFPAMSAYFITSKYKLELTFEKAVFYMMIISIPISIMIMVLANGIIDLAFPRFHSAVHPLQVLILSLPVIFMNFPVGTLLNAVNKTKLTTLNMAITVLVNLSINALLIKRFSYMGSAFATLVSGITLFGLGLYWVNKQIKVPFKSLFKKLIRAYIPAIIAGLAVCPLRGEFSFKILGREASVVALIILYFIIYFALLFLFRGIIKSEIVDFKNSFIHKKSA
ncbi:MAG: flippase [Patescibacteria group bacterium]|jgi:O-antigen/teichoic acid export membrane protein